MATPGWWVLIGAGGTREAEDGQAEPVVLQHSARTGMMSAKVSPSATVMNSLTERTTAGERKGTDRGGSASCTTPPGSKTLLNLAS